MNQIIFAGLALASGTTYDPNHRSNCHADGRRLERATTDVAKNATFLELGQAAGNPAPMDDQYIYKSYLPENANKCLDDTFVAGFLQNKGGCKLFACEPDRYAYCADNAHCMCPDGMCAVAVDKANTDDLKCQIQRTRTECPPGSSVFWLAEHMEVEYHADDDSCTFVKTTGVDELWDAVAWSDNPNLRDITFHTIGKNADRDFGYTADPIADSTEEPIKHGVHVSLDINDKIAPPPGLVVENAGHISTVRMNIVEAGTTHFEFSGKEWGYNRNNLDVAHMMHAILWIKQRCGKLKITNISVEQPCILSDWSGWGTCHPENKGGKNCGPGIQDRTRSIIQQGTYGHECKDALDDHQSCDQGCCPVDCEVAEWAPWGDCSTSCGNGQQTRKREVTQKPSCGGKECAVTAESESCNWWVECPPRDCEWTEWGDFSKCSATCDGGTQMRMRQIANTSFGGGLACDEKDAVQIDSCATQECDAVNCEWTSWGEWGACTAQCQGGTRTRSRTVTQEAKHGGDVCDAASGDQEECNLQPCTDTWTAGDGADIEVDGITFQGEAANSVVTSQKGVESISVKNGAVTGGVQIGLSQDNNPNFDTGAQVVLPYKDATDTDVITVGTQDGHVKVFVNSDFKEDLGKVGPTDTLLAKIILDQGASVRVDGIQTPGPASQLAETASSDLSESREVKTTSVPSWAIAAAIAPLSMIVMAAVSHRRARQAGPGVQEPLLH